MNKNTVFTDLQNNYAYPAGIENHYWNKSRNQILLNELKLRNIKTIMDFGCGAGIFLDFCGANGIDCYGVEPSLEGERSSNSNIFSSIQILFERINDHERIDCICLLDVIEHIQDPGSVLRSIVEKFPTVEYLLITVPSCQELWSNYDEYYGHFKRYNLDDLEKIAREIPLFEIDKIKYLFKSLYFPARILSRFSSREVKITAPMSKFSIFVHSLAAKYFTVESQIMNEGVKGTSLLMILKKS